MLPVDSSECNALRPGGRHDTGCSPCHDRLGRRDDRSLWRRRDRPGSRPMAVSDAVSVIDPVVETMVGHLDAAVGPVVVKRPNVVKTPTVKTSVLVFRSLFVLASQVELYWSLARFTALNWFP